MYTQKLDICGQCRCNGGFPMTEMGRQIAVKARSCKSLPPPWWPKNFEYWRNAFLPTWIQRIDYSSKTKWVILIGKLGGIPISHMGKSRLKFFLKTKPSFKIASNGSPVGTWADPQQAPPSNLDEARNENKVPALLGGNRGWNPI